MEHNSIAMKYDRMNRGSENDLRAMHFPEMNIIEIWSSCFLFGHFRAISFMICLFPGVFLWHLYFMLGACMFLLVVLCGYMSACILCADDCIWVLILYIPRCLVLFMVYLCVLVFLFVVPRRVMSDAFPGACFVLCVAFSFVGACTFLCLVVQLRLFFDVHCTLMSGAHLGSLFFIYFWCHTFVFCRA